MTKVTFYNNHDKGGLATPFSDPQAKNSSVNGTNCIVTESSTWLVVYSESDYKGDYMKVGPNTEVPQLSKVDRASGGDWKNNSNSFIMYGVQPSWWNNSGTPPRDIPVPSNGVLFTDDDHFSGDNRTYTGPLSYSDLNDHHYTTNSGKDLKNNITSLKTGTNAWLQIWDETDYTGNFAHIYPNTTYVDLNDLKRGSSGDWNDQIQSFNLYTSLPAAWNLGFDTNSFIQSFPNYTVSSDMDGTYYEYQSQDCPYHIHLLGTTYPTDSQMQLSFKICYDTMGHNDQVFLDIFFDGDGSYNSLQYSYEQGGAIQIPSTLIKAVDVSAEILGAVGALESAGISEAAAQEFVETFDNICKAFNKISNVIYKLSEANDGRFYLVPVVCHVVNRAINAVTISN